MNLVTAILLGLCGVGLAFPRTARVVGLVVLVAVAALVLLSLAGFHVGYPARVVNW